MQPLLKQAVAALGWRGLLVPDVAVLGQQVSAVVRLRRDVHTWRSRNGWPPQADPSWFRSWFEPDRHRHLPVAAVELVGVLVNAPAADRALQSCGTLMTLAPCVVVLPETPPVGSWSVIELDYYGVGVVAADRARRSANLVVPPEDRSAEFGPSLFGRWLLEVLYDRVVEAQPTDVTTLARELRARLTAEVNGPEVTAQGTSAPGVDASGVNAPEVPAPGGGAPGVNRQAEAGHSSGWVG